ncbi:hypothetical protein KY290_029334 [Solanum tuberosum]|uniref:Uncharacterized protein n=1 Tax=Solanum tuberosum TaxID=4113 RepID=A0ABQ7UKH9_SOLTU|nr:hypothetical protein KY284_028340 [Solanum tuberosum]KAH0750102.1 hypothetical protein KY290_029334 [Solanum tuberosum]
MLRKAALLKPLDQQSSPEAYRYLINTLLRNIQKVAEKKRRHEISRKYLTLPRDLINTKRLLLLEPV